MVEERHARKTKIAYIGGGSRHWARHIMTDLALCEHLGGEIALYDIDYEAALPNAGQTAGPLNLMRRVVGVQQLTLRAAIDEDVDRTFQAILNDPLCRIPVDAAWTMFRERLAANQDMLPGRALP